MSANLGAYLNIRQVEHYLSEYRPPRRTVARDTPFTIDLSACIWVSPLSLSALFCFAHDLAGVGYAVSFVPPSPGSFAAAFFSEADVTTRIIEAGYLLRGSREIGGGFQGRLACFERFASPDALEHYVQRLDDPETRRLVLHLQSQPEIVSSGQFNRVAVRELVDNAFVHADGVNAHCIAFEANPSRRPRDPHPIVAHFDGAGYVEICAGDSGRSNIVDTLLSHMPEGYEPRVTINQRGKLDKRERCILYAFEYGATSQKERRASLVRGFLERGTDDASSIATGLHNVLSLARFYGGQVVIRTAGRLGTIDFTSPSSDRPRVAFWRNVAGKTLAPLWGTIVCLRVPTGRMGVHRLVSPQRRTVPSQAPLSIQIPVQVVIPEWRLGSEYNVVQQLLGIESKAASAIATAKRPQVVVLLLDGMNIPSKTFGAFLALVAQLPRNDCGLVVAIDDTQQVRAAAEQWQVVEEGRIARSQLTHEPSFVIAVDQDVAATIYGALEHPESTSTDGAHLECPHNRSTSLARTVQAARKERLARHLAKAPIRHHDGLYLIESLYYTTTFYQVALLLEDASAHATLVRWLVGELSAVKPRVILYEPAFFERVLCEAIELLADPKPTLVAGRRDTIVSLTMEVGIAAGRTGTILIVSDVLCTARLLQRVMEVLPRDKTVHVLTLVDTRDSEYPYATVPTAYGSIDLNVIAVHKERLIPLYDRPADVRAADVFLIDRLTHAPTKYHLPEDVGLSPQLLLEKSDAVGALGAGHFVFRERHYVYFIGFRDAFAAIGSELEQWLGSQVQELRSTAGVNLSKVRVLCLDEDTGLFQRLAGS